MTIWFFCLQKCNSDISDKILNWKLKTIPNCPHKLVNHLNWEKVFNYFNPFFNDSKIRYFSLFFFTKFIYVYSWEMLNLYFFFRLRKSERCSGNDGTKVGKSVELRSFIYQTQTPFSSPFLSFSFKSPSNYSLFSLPFLSFNHTCKLEKKNSLFGVYLHFFNLFFEQNSWRKQKLEACSE